LQCAAGPYRRATSRFRSPKIMVKNQPQPGRKTPYDGGRVRDLGFEGIWDLRPGWYRWFWPTFYSLEIVDQKYVLTHLYHLFHLFHLKEKERR
jgi:hypothetical protein